MMFDEAYAAAFARRWDEGVVLTQQEADIEPPVPLVTVATQVGIAPLALYQAVTSGRRIRGLMPPTPLSTVPPLVFEPVAVRDFVEAFRGLLKKN